MKVGKIITNTATGLTIIIETIHTTRITTVTRTITITIVPKKWKTAILKAALTLQQLAQTAGWLREATTS